MATEIRVAILGKTGTGKSAVGNSLLGNKIFESKSSMSSTTRQCKLGEAQTSIGKLLVVDTPGLFDTAKPNEETIKELIKCIALLAPGPHVFIFVLSADRFTRDDVETVAILKQILGKDTMHHVMVVFTRKDQLDDDMTVEKVIAESPMFLKSLLRDVNNRYEFICNRQNNSSHQQDVENVLSLIKRTVQQNGDRYYTQSMFQAAENVIQKEIQGRQKKEKKENKSNEDYRQEIRTDIANNDQSIISKIFYAVIEIVKEVLPHVITAIGAYFSGKK